MSATALNAPAPSVRLLEPEETLTVARLWNDLCRQFTDRLAHRGIELGGDPVFRSLAFILIRKAAGAGGDGVLISIVSADGSWSPRPALNYGAVSDRLLGVADHLDSIASRIQEAPHLDRVRIAREISAAALRLTEPVLQIEDADPAGERPSWRRIESRHMPSIYAGVRLVREGAVA